MGDEGQTDMSRGRHATPRHASIPRTKEGGAPTRPYREASTLSRGSRRSKPAKQRSPQRVRKGPNPARLPIRSLRMSRIERAVRLPQGKNTKTEYP